MFVGRIPDMKSQLIKIPVTEVRIGMYVAELDCSWLETPFMFQGFLVNGLKEIEMLRQYCHFVVIDKTINKLNLPRQTPNRTEDNPPKIKTLNEILPQRRHNRYQNKVSVKNELKVARRIYLDLNRFSQKLFKFAGKPSKETIKEIQGLIDPMVDSIIRNPDAMIWMANLKQRDSYSYKHCISASVWAISLGRQLGLPKDDLKVLAMGTLLCDIGKSELPKDILKKTGSLSAEEFEIAKKHVDYSLSMLEEGQVCDPEMVEIVANHHERHNGQGYPKGLRGDEIPIFARIAAIADCYDAITSDRPHVVGCSASHAMKKLYEWRDYEFQAELVEEFIQAIGIYPVGSLVELNTGEVCVVIEEGRELRLKPVVMRVLDADKNPLESMEFIDLKVIQQTADGGALFIDKCLQPGAYDIDPEALYL
jgi:putative nucleotidyltransferase with HDIG domain